MLTLTGSSTRETAGFTGLVDDLPFRIGLVGPLWRDRTLNGGDGAQDFAQVVRDEPLDVDIRGSAEARIAEVELRVDGRRQRIVASRCAQGRCPRSVRVTFVPLLRRLQPGDHQVEIVARDPHGAATSRDTGAHVSVSRFGVRTVARVPAVVESQPVAKLPGHSGASGIDTRLERAALRVLRAPERRTRGIASALGAARIRVIYVGDLNVRGRRLGATMLVELVPPRRGVRVIVPAYTPASRDSNVPYTTQRVRMYAKALRDVLIDVDLARRRVIAFEPGPRSETLSWSPSRAPAPAGAGDED